MKIEHAALYVRDLKGAKRFFETYFEAGYHHLAFSLGSREKVNELTARLQADGYQLLSGPRLTGDGYYESCILALEGNQIELTV